MTPNTVEFRSTSDNTWVMRITADKKIEVNEDVDVTFAAQKVLDAMQGLLTPQRTWVGLTEEELCEIVGVSTNDSDWNVYKVQEWLRKVEAKLKEKNA